MNAHYQKAVALLQHGWIDLAEEEARRALSEEPELAVAHALLASCHLSRSRYAEAREAATTAVRLRPDKALCHCVLAKVYTEVDDYARAEEAAREAVRLEPESAEHHGLLASAIALQDRWTESLLSAQAGLRLDPAEECCRMTHAAALQQLARSEEALATIQESLALHPENPFAHYNMGWWLMSRGRWDEGLRHFEEALRLDPESEIVQEQAAEAFKARFGPYRLLQYFGLWLSRRSPTLRGAVIFGLFLPLRILRDAADTYPALLPLAVAYGVLHCLILTGVPVSNLALRLSRRGRLFLSREQITTSSIAGVFLVASLTILAGGWVSGSPHAAAWSMALLLVVFPIASVLGARPSERALELPRKLLGGVLLLAGVIFALGSGVTAAVSGLLLAAFLLFACLTAPPPDRSPAPAAG